MALKKAEKAFNYKQPQVFVVALNPRKKINYLFF